eukprot:1612226-Rhodomonas_salina.1
MMVEVERTLTSVGASGFQGHVVRETKEQHSMSVFNSEIEAAAAAAMLAWRRSAALGQPCWVAALHAFALVEAIALVAHGVGVDECAVQLLAATSC